MAFLADFEVAFGDMEALNSLLDGSVSVVPWDIYVLLGGAPVWPNGKPSEGFLQVAASVLSMVSRPFDIGMHWRPREAVPHGPDVPSDLGRAAAAKLSAAAAQARNPGLRARFADVAWCADRTLRDAAALSVDAYCESIDRLRQSWPDLQSSDGTGWIPVVKSIDFAARAIEVSHQTHKQGKRPERLTEAFMALYRLTRDGREPALFERMAKLAVRHELVEPAGLARDAEDSAAPSGRRQMPMAGVGALGMAANVHHRLGDAEARRRCQLKAAHLMLAMRAEVSTKGAEVHWMKAALQVLQEVKDADDLKRKLRKEMRDLQEDSIGDMGEVPLLLDLSDADRAAEEHFGCLDLPSALRDLAMLSSPPAIEALRREAEAVRAQAPLLAALPSGPVDQRGRDLARRPGAKESGDCGDPWFKAMAIRLTMPRRLKVSDGLFEAARRNIAGRFDIGEQHLSPIAELSRFAAAGQKGLLSLGFTRLLQGDYRSAVHLLIPQIEPCLRHGLAVAGHDPSVVLRDMTERDTGLPQLLAGHRKALEAVFTADLILEVEMIFHDRAGPALRHEVAHGLLGDWACHGSDAVYACWFIYRLVCLPLLADWDRLVAPLIDAAAGRGGGKSDRKG